MDKLYAPWRDRYVRSSKETKNSAVCCIFCDVFQKDTNKALEERFILYKNDTIGIMLNLYPYNGGHLLLFARNHVQQLYDIPSEITQQLMRALCLSTKIVQDVLSCDGMNVGANIGKDAGAGIPSHAHLHIVPRWQGDTGFLPILADTKQISVNLEQVYNRLKPVFDTVFLESKL